MKNLRGFTPACALLNLIPAQDLYRQPLEDSDQWTRHFPIYSCGEHLLRAAAATEQTFGGLTANLWDDPFEWTLPETLSTRAYRRILNRSRSDTATRLSTLRRRHGLAKEIVVPSGEAKKLGALLLETLVRAAHHEGKALRRSGFCFRSTAARLISQAHLYTLSSGTIKSN
jgi:hypothetical protein